MTKQVRINCTTLEKVKRFCREKGEKGWDGTLSRFITEAAEEKLKRDRRKR